MDLAVLASCLHHETSYSGEFVRELLDALTEGSSDSRWRDGDAFINLVELRDELHARLGGQQYAAVAGVSGISVIPNIRYRADAADRAVELGDLLRQLDPADREHFLRKAASTDAGDVGWFFTGRRKPFRQIVDWLATSPGGMFVITGVPGAGKSAFLGHLAVLADANSQPACRALGLLDDPHAPRPMVGSIDAVIHLKNLRVDDAALGLADQLGINLSNSPDPARDLIVTLHDTGRRVAVLADALDEAERGEEEYLARDVLRAIASLPGCRVIVGTRRDRDGRHNAHLDDPGPLITALRPREAEQTVVDLSADTDSDADIADYVHDRLAQQHPDTWPDPGRRRTVAQEVSRQARRVFLYARFALRVLERLDQSILETPAWQDRLPRDVGKSGLHDVFAQDLQRLPDAEGITEMLTPLAFTRGKGLPDATSGRSWPPLCHRTGRAYNAADISRVIREAGWYLTEATEDGQAVFRLYHQAIADHLRREVTDAL